MKTSGRSSGGGWSAVVQELGLLAAAGLASRFTGPSGAFAVLAFATGNCDNKNMIIIRYRFITVMYVSPL